MIADMIDLKGMTVGETASTFIRAFGGDRVKAVEALEYFLRRRKLSLKDVNHIHAVITELERKP